MKYDKNDLENLVKRICEITGLPNTKEQAITAGVPQYLSLDPYGPYRLVMVNVKGGGANDAFGLGYNIHSPNEMHDILSALIAGLSYKNQKTLAQ